MTKRLVRTDWNNQTTRSAWRAASWTVVVLLLLMTIAGCANVPAPPSVAAPAVAPNSAITGTATFAERTILPANAVFEATP